MTRKQWMKKQSTEKERIKTMGFEANALVRKNIYSGDIEERSRGRTPKGYINGYIDGKGEFVEGRPKAFQVFDKPEKAKSETKSISESNGNGLSEQINTIIAKEVANKVNDKINQAISLVTDAISALEELKDK